MKVKGKYSMRDFGKLKSGGNVVLNNCNNNDNSFSVAVIIPSDWFLNNYILPNQAWAAEHNQTQETAEYSMHSYLMFNRWR